MAKPTIISERFDAKGNLVEVTYDFTDCCSLDKIIAVSRAQARIQGPHFYKEEERRWVTDTVFGPAPLGGGGTGAGA